MTESGWLARCVSEFLGTYLLIVTVGCNVIGAGPAWAATSIACVLMVSVYALGGISGAHFNPAVSLTLGLSGKHPWKDVGIYVVLQLIAGCCAGLTYALLFGKAFHLGPSPGFGWWEAMLAETLYTFMLCFVVLNVATTEKDHGNQFYGLAIGFVIVAGGYGAGAISGGCFNPAVAMGIDVASIYMNGVAKYAFWGPIYFCYEIVGAALASVLFRLCRPDEFGGNPDYGLGAKIASEFLGTYFLILTVGLNVLASSPAAAWSIAASLMCMIYALGSCSGAHFNPAVTVAVVASGRGKCRVIDGAAYVFVQIAAGVLAAFTYAAMHHGKTFELGPGKGWGWASVGVAEATFTFVLCFVVLSVATTSEPLEDFFGLAIGSCVTVGGYAIGAISGGSLNPAVSFGIASAHAMNNNGTWYNCLIYSAFELVGGALAAGVFWATRPSEYAKSTRNQATRSAMRYRQQ